MNKILLFLSILGMVNTYAQVPGKLIIADEQLIKIGPKAPYAKSADAGYVFQHEFHNPGSSYIKIHFKGFDLAPGDYVEVFSPLTGISQVYSEKGKLVDNGETMISDFWSGMLEGDRVKVRLWSSGRSMNSGFVMDKVAYGYPQATIEAMMQKSICGNDNKEQVICYNGTDMYTNAQAVCRLIIGGSGLCTGWLLGSEGHVMTNNHCITTTADAQNTDFQFNYENTDCTGVGPATPDIVANTSTLICTSAQFDYTLVELPVNPTPTYGYLSFRATPPTVGERIYIPQHPGGRRKEIAVNDDQSFSGLAVVVDDGNRVEYLCDTEGGSSGSPVISFMDNLVVALHNTGGCPNGGNRNNNIIDDMGSCLPLNAVGAVNLPPSAAFDSDVNCFTVDFSDMSTNFPDSWSWSFGDGNTDTVPSPTHVYGAYGTYSVTLICSNPIGSDTITGSVTIGPDPVPMVDSVLLCSPSMTVLTASGSSSFSWYDAPTGGSLLAIGANFATGIITSDTIFYVGTTGPCAAPTLTPLVVSLVDVDGPDSVQTATGCEGDILSLQAFGSGDYLWYTQSTGGGSVGAGSSFSTPALTTSQTYYVAAQVASTSSEQVGPMDGSFGTGNHFDLDRRLVFNALDDITIVSAWVDAGSDGTRTIEVFDGATSIASTTVFIPQGQGRVNLGLSVPAGNDYELAITSATRDLYRNNGGVSYPYVSDHVEITASTAGTPAGFYYFFYDWEVEVGQICESVRTPVQADIVSAPLVSISLSGALLDAGTGFASYQWYLNGSPIAGATGQTHTAVVDGNYFCVVTNATGCEGTSNDVDVIVQSVNEQFAQHGFALWPNPAYGVFNVSVEAGSGGRLQLYTATGSLVLESRVVDGTQQLDVSGLEKGVYLVQMVSDRGVGTQRLIIE